jgi:CubicO group peptidase (beta-lactamase class C family)
MFLLGSISKPIVMTGLMSLFERGEFALTDPIRRFIPEFCGDGREHVTMLHVLTHVSGLPDQVAENPELRRSHAPLLDFVRATTKAPLLFSPGANYGYSSMGIMLAARVAEIITGTDILSFTRNAVFGPLKMTRSAQGLGGFKLDDFEPMQIEFAAPEAGGGDPSSKDWNWNSLYWRQLGAPWGGTHASAGDVAKVLEELLLERGQVLKPETARLMIRNHNAAGQTPRGLGWSVGSVGTSAGCSEKTFGHTGSTGTIAWADPSSNTVCVVLTTLPARAITPHPRDVAAAHVAAASSR